MKRDGVVMGIMMWVSSGGSFRFDGVVMGVLMGGFKWWEFLTCRANFRAVLRQEAGGGPPRLKWKKAFTASSNQVGPFSSFFSSLLKLIMKTHEYIQC